MVQMAVEWLFIRDNEEWDFLKNPRIRRDMKAGEVIKELGSEKKGNWTPIQRGYLRKATIIMED